VFPLDNFAQPSPEALVGGMSRRCASHALAPLHGSLWWSGDYHCEIPACERTSEHTTPTRKRKQARKRGGNSHRPRHQCSNGRKKTSQPARRDKSGSLFCSDLPRRKEGDILLADAGTDTTPTPTRHKDRFLFPTQRPFNRFRVVRILQPPSTIVLKQPTHNPTEKKRHNP
jgi:hypothetical protein